VNFSIPEIGSIHRYDMGGARHRRAGRFHQHIIVGKNDVRLKLPNAESRNDLKGIEPEAAWNKICSESAIVHTGEFFPPECFVHE
jgi:hypothetical protein